MAIQVKSFTDRRLEVARLVVMQHGRTWTGLANVERSKMIDAAETMIRSTEELFEPEKFEYVLYSNALALAVFQACGSPEFGRQAYEKLAELERIARTIGNIDTFVHTGFVLREENARTHECTRVWNWEHLHGDTAGRWVEKALNRPTATNEPAI